MAKKTTDSQSKTPVARASTPDVTTTPVRNTALPPKIAAAAPTGPKKAPPAADAIARRAYFIWQSSGGGQFDNWIRAERELAAL